MVLTIYGAMVNHHHQHQQEEHSDIGQLHHHHCTIYGQNHQLRVQDLLGWSSPCIGAITRFRQHKTAHLQFLSYFGLEIRSPLLTYKDHHLVSSDKGREDVHLLLLTAVHLEIKQPLKDSCSWPAPWSVPWRCCCAPSWWCRCPHSRGWTRSRSNKIIPKHVMQHKWKWKYVLRSGFFGKNLQFCKMAV